MKEITYEDILCAAGMFLHEGEACSRARVERSLEVLEHAVIGLRRRLAASSVPKGSARILPIAEQAAGIAELNGRGWVRLRLFAPLVNSRRSPTGYIESTIGELLRLLGEENGALPWFDRAAVVITDREERERGSVFDPDNLDWKCVTNAMKGALFEDDDSRTLTLLLRAAPDASGGCEIVVLPPADLPAFLSPPRSVLDRAILKMGRYLTNRDGHSPQNGTVFCETARCTAPK